jgi:hypothetical protein
VYSIVEVSKQGVFSLIFWERSSKPSTQVNSSLLFWKLQYSEFQTKHQAKVKTIAFPLSYFAYRLAFFYGLNILLALLDLKISVELEVNGVKRSTASMPMLRSGKQSAVASFDDAFLLHVPIILLTLCYCSRFINQGLGISFVHTVMSMVHSLARLLCEHNQFVVE